MMFVPKAPRASDLLVVPGNPHSSRDESAPG
jgi:hypothetical protein